MATLKVYDGTKWVEVSAGDSNATATTGLILVKDCDWLINLNGTGDSVQTLSCGPIGGSGDIIYRPGALIATTGIAVFAMPTDYINQSLLVQILHRFNTLSGTYTIEGDAAGQFSNARFWNDAITNSTNYTWCWDYNTTSRSLLIYKDTTKGVLLASGCNIAGTTPTTIYLQSMNSSALSGQITQDSLGATDNDTLNIIRGSGIVDLQIGLRSLNNYYITGYSFPTIQPSVVTNYSFIGNPQESYNYCRVLNVMISGTIISGIKPMDKVALTLTRTKTTTIDNHPDILRLLHITIYQLNQ